MGGRPMTVWASGLALAWLLTVCAYRHERIEPVQPKTDDTPRDTEASRRAAGWFAPSFSPHRDEEYHPLPFDAECWKQGDPWVRFSMLADLLERHPLKGMTAGEVQELLGPLEQGYQGGAGMTYVYWVERPTGLDSSRDYSERAPIPDDLGRAKALLLDFGADGRVRDHRFLD